MGKLASAVILTLGVMVGGVAATELINDVGPVPTCNGEQATIVLVEFGTADLYSEWSDAGVVVAQDPDNAVRGTWGHDVIVTLVETMDGGLISEPLRTPTSPQPTAGDFMCSAVPGADDIYYATHGRSDVILDSGGGSDNYFLGGCYLETDGTSTCDRLVSTGGGNADTDRIWGSKVPAGRTQQIILDNSMDHVYVGKGTGKVIVKAAGAPTSAPGGGDHVHPCPIDSSDPKYLTVESFTKNKIVTTDVEYFGPESEFLPLNQVNDPCAYQQKGI